MANEKARYSDVELEEFRAIIEEKLKVAKQTYRDCMAQLNHSDSNDVVDTSPTYKALEEGSEAQSKEEIIQMAQRQQKFTFSKRTSPRSGTNSSCPFFLG